MSLPHSPSGERRPISPRVELTTQNRPLAGRTKIEQRLDAYCRRNEESPQKLGFLGLPTGEQEVPPYDPIFIEHMFPPIEDDRPGSLARICVACALGGATLTALVAIAIFSLTRPAAALVPALPPRVPMEQDVVFGVVALGIILLIAGGMALYGILRRDVKVSARENIPASSPLQDHGPYRRPVRGPCFGEDDRYA